MNTGRFGMNAYNDGKAKAQKANKYDAKYNAVKPSVGIFGDAGALDWTGRGARTGGGAQAGTRDGVVARAKANGLSSDQQMWRDAGALSQKQINSQKRGRRRAEDRRQSGRRSRRRSSSGSSSSGLVVFREGPPKSPGPSRGRYRKCPFIVHTTHGALNRAPRRDRDLHSPHLAIGESAVHGRRLGTARGCRDRPDRRSRRADRRGLRPRWCLPVVPAEPL